MSDNFHLRDAAGKVDAIVSLSVYDPGMVNMVIYSSDDGIVHLLRHSLAAQGLGLPK